jgi:hypothetical protein
MRVNSYSESVRLSKLNLNWMKDQVEKAAKAVCTENNSGAQCADLTSIRAVIKEGLPNALASDDLASYKDFTQKIDSRIASLKELTQAERDPIAHYDKTVQRLAAITSIPPEPYYAWKIVGILFLPSALALRITKISVEFFGWFPKA